MREELWMLLGVAGVVVVMGLIFYLQARFGEPPQPADRLPDVSYCDLCVHRQGEFCNHPLSPVTGQSCEPVDSGKVACEERQMARAG